MRKIALLGLGILLCLSALAETKHVKVDYKTKRKGGITVERAPINLPIEVIYDTESFTVQVMSLSDELEAEVYVYNAFDELEDYSPCLNTILTVTESDYHTIVIESENWTGYGVIE